MRTPAEERYTVTRSNGRIVERVGRLGFYAARRLVERDLATGTSSRMDRESRSRASGRYVA